VANPKEILDTCPPYGGKYFDPSVDEEAPPNYIEKQLITV